VIEALYRRPTQTSRSRTQDLPRSAAWSGDRGRTSVGDGQTYIPLATRLCISPSMLDWFSRRICQARIDHDEASFCVGDIVFEEAGSTASRKSQTGSRLTVHRKGVYGCSAPTMKSRSAWRQRSCGTRLRQSGYAQREIRGRISAATTTCGRGDGIGRYLDLYNRPRRTRASTA